MRGRTFQNVLFSLLIGVLGAFASSYSSIVDRIATGFSMDVSMVGLLISVYAAGSFASVLLSGSLADTLGKRRVVSVTSLVLSIGAAFAAIVSAQWLLYPALFLAGFGFGPTESIGSAYLTDENPGKQTLWMNISQICFCIGAIVAPLAAIYYIERGGSYRGVLLFCAGLVFVFWLMIMLTRNKNAVTPIVSRDKNPLSVLKSREFLFYGLMIFVYLGYEAMAPAYFKQYMLSKGAAESTSALAISLFWAAMIVFRFVGAFMGGKELFCIRWFSLMVPVGVVILLVSGTTLGRMAGVILYGFGCGPVWPMLVVMAVKVFPERSGAACAMMMVFSTLGNSLFPVMIGTLVNNLTATMIICAVMATGISICAAYVARKYAS